VAHERVAVVASSLVMWHARGCWGCVVVGGSDGDMARRGAVDAR